MPNPVDWVTEVKIRNAIAHAIRQIDAEAHLTNLQNLEQKSMVTTGHEPDHRAGADPMGSP